jgi:calcium/calmodulin-dependent protein kinase I
LPKFPLIFCFPLLSSHFVQSHDKESQIVVQKQKPHIAQSLPLTFDAQYDIGSKVGEGSFSVVRVATRRNTGESVAVKIVARHDIPIEDEVALRLEVEILQKMDHPNIVKCLDFFEEEDYFYIVMEYLEGGELFDRIVKKQCYNEKEARDLVSAILSAMKYYHDKDIVHRYGNNSDE